MKGFLESCWACVSLSGGIWNGLRRAGEDHFPVVSSPSSFPFAGNRELEMLSIALSARTSLALE